MLKTYILAPNFTFHLDGPIQIGNIISNPLQPTKTLSSFRPSTSAIHSTSVPPNQSIVFQNEGQGIDRSVWGKFLQIVSGKLDASRNKDVFSGSFTFDELETFWIDDPRDNEIVDCIKEEKVQAAINAGLFGRRPVYMITGLKIARGFKAVKEQSSTSDVAASGSVPTAETITELHSGEDIIFAYQLHIIAERGWRIKSVTVSQYVPKAGSSEALEEDDRMGISPMTATDLQKISDDQNDVSIQITEAQDGNEPISCVSFTDEALTKEGPERGAPEEKATDSSPPKIPASYNGNSFTLSSLNAEEGNSSKYRLLEAHGALNRTQKRRLKDLQVELQSYLGANTWLCKIGDLEKFKTGMPKEDYIKGSRYIPPHLKIQPGLKPSRNEKSGRIEASLRTVDVVLHPSTDQSAEEVTQYVHLNGIPTKSMSIRHDGSIIRMEVDSQYLDDIARLDSISSIEEVHDVMFYNNVARNVIRTNIPINSTSYKGENQIITVADSGLDMGDTEDLHPAFTGRVRHLVSFGRETDTNDPIGHGTHVCGSALGNGTSDIMGGPIQGAAPEAYLIMQSIIDDNNKSVIGIKKDIHDLLKDAYDRGSRIHTNSWGPVWQDKDTKAKQYGTADGKAVDKFVWENKDMVVCFAAGNHGDKSTTHGHIGAWAASKNCITVGSCNNQRRARNIQCDIFDATGTVEGNPDEISFFSSRGPTEDDLIKPDVVAPGAMILSAASRAAPPDESFGRSEDREWTFMSGTSMSTPLVAGCAAVLREVLMVKNDIENPSAALIKAMLINGAVRIEGTQEEQGFGRVDLMNSIIIKKRPEVKSLGGTDDAAKNVQNNDFYEGVVIDEDEEDEVMVHFTLGEYMKDEATTGSLKTTMVYSDLPGSCLQNNLNLSVIVDNGKGAKETRYGNMGNRIGPNLYDETNTAEQVLWPDIPRDSIVTLTVYLRQIISPPNPPSQPFALVWSVM